jgi:hypothetical protein
MKNVTVSVEDYYDNDEPVIEGNHSLPVLVDSKKVKGLTPLNKVVSINDLFVCVMAPIVPMNNLLGGDHESTYCFLSDLISELDNVDTGDPSQLIVLRVSMETTFKVFLLHPQG